MKRQWQSCTAPSTVRESVTSFPWPCFFYAFPHPFFIHVSLWASSWLHTDSYFSDSVNLLRYATVHWSIHCANANYYVLVLHRLPHHDPPTHSFPLLPEVVCTVACISHLWHIYCNILLCVFMFSYVIYCNFKSLYSVLLPILLICTSPI